MNKPDQRRERLLVAMAAGAALLLVLYGALIVYAALQRAPAHGPAAAATTPAHTLAAPASHSHGGKP